MDERTANIVAQALGGSAWQSGGDIWLVVIHRADGSVVAISEDCICEYVDERAFDSGNVTHCILLHSATPA